MGSKELMPENDLQELWELKGRVAALSALLLQGEKVQTETILYILNVEEKEIEAYAERK